MDNLILLQINWFTKSYTSLVKKVIGSIIKKAYLNNNNITLKTNQSNVKIVLLFLNKHTLCRYKQLIDIAAEDVPTNSNRFTINYIISSITYNHRVLLSITTNELDYLPSAVSIFSSACWLEREVWDLFGVFFKGNPDLRRILTDYGFSGHPLRKDFPLSGFYEIYYSLDKKRILTEPIELAQEYRVFTL